DAVARAGRAPAVLLSLPALHRLAGDRLEAAVADLVSLWTIALAAANDAPVVSIGLGGLADLVLAEGDPYRAGRLAEAARSAAGETSVALFVDDADAALRLGLSRFSAVETWQTADGGVTARLRPALAAAIARS